MFAHACKVGLEGVVSKVRDSRYSSGRGNDWVKKTCAQRETLTIAGFALDGNKWDGIYVGRRKGNDLVYAGKVDHGFDKTSAAELRKRLTPLIRKTQPYAKKIAHRAHLGRTRVAGRDRVPREVRRRKGATPLLQGHPGGPMNWSHVASANSYGDRCNIRNHGAALLYGAPVNLRDVTRVHGPLLPARQRRTISALRLLTEFGKEPCRDARSDDGFNNLAESRHCRAT